MMVETEIDLHEKTLRRAAGTARVQRARCLPWGKPRRELLLLALVAIAALTVLPSVSSEDTSRVCLAQELLHGRLTIDHCSEETVDRSRYDGHLYSNKAPGLSLLEAPIVGLVQPTARLDARLWATRLVSGAFFLLCVLLVGRVGEGLAPGRGGIVLVTFGLGTLMAPLAVTGFAHVPAACAGFAAFLLAWARRPFAAGLSAGLALLIEYEAAVIAAAVGAYVLIHGGRQLLSYAAGVAPGAALLGAYDWLAFGAPWHNPLSYSDNDFRAAHHLGFLGVRHPSESALELVVIGYRGLLVLSPVLIAVTVGLWLLWRRGLRAEAVLCAAVSVAFLLLDAGYFDPYGFGPGPRFVAPAVPFSALALAAVFARLPIAALALAIPSVLATLAITLTWTGDTNYAGSIWGQIVRLPFDRGSTDIVRHLLPNALDWVGVGHLGAAAIVLMGGATALIISVLPARSRVTRGRRP
jgi:hypothetical protein